MSADHPNVWAAWTAAWADLTDVPKTSKADMGTYKIDYADLPSVLAHVRPVLAAHGLAIYQDVTGTADTVGVSTVIVHGNGGEIRTGPVVMPAGRGPQAVGSAISYARRYSLLATLGLGTADDDANTAQKAVANAITPAQMKAMSAAFGDMPKDDRLEYAAQIVGRDLGASKDLTSDEARTVIAALNTPTEDDNDE